MQRMANATHVVQPRDKQKTLATYGGSGLYLEGFRLQVATSDPIQGSDIFWAACMVSKATDNEPKCTFCFNKNKKKHTQPNNSSATFKKTRITSMPQTRKADSTGVFHKHLVTLNNSSSSANCKSRRENRTSPKPGHFGTPLDEAGIILGFPHHILGRVHQR